MNINVLYVDDEVELAKSVTEYFNMFDVSAMYVTKVSECFEFLKDNTVDILLLDINLEDGNGFEICKKVRESLDIPILFISARGTDDDVLTALNIGGDDYIKKPFSLSVLLAKVKASLKRVKLLEDARKSGITDDDMDEKIVLDESVLSVKVNGKVYALKAKEFALIKCLYEHKNTIVTKEKLFEEVWGDGYYGDGTLNVHIRKLREKIENNPNEPEIIKTVWGTGYILNA